MAILEDVNFTVKGLYGHQIGQLEMILETGAPIQDEDRTLMVQALARMEQLERAYRNVKQERDELRKKESKRRELQLDSMINIVQEMRDIVASPKKEGL